MKIWRKRALGASLCGVVLAIVACSSQSDGNDPRDPAAAVGTTQEAVQASAPPSNDAPASERPAYRLVTATGLPINVMPVYKKRAVGVTSNACGGTAPSLKYLGGPVIQNAHIVSVLWTTNVDPNAKTQLPNFYTDLLASTYFDQLGEYSTGGVTPTDGQPGTTQGISRGTYVGQYTITPSVCAGTAACTVTDTQIASELSAQITAGHLPPIVTGCDGQVSSLYIFEFPANVTITLTVGGTTSGSCTAFCGYHENTTIGGKIVPYGVLPDLESGPCASACSESPPASLKDVTSVHSHEVAEAVTDTAVTITTSYVRPSAWGDENCGEIGDICNFQEQSTTLNGATWTVQQLWSNALNDCSVTGKPPSVCTGANTPAGCRACECSDVSYTGPTTTLGCDGATPQCETTATNVKHGDCVQCTSAAGCTAAQVCEQSSTAASDDICTACGAASEPCCTGSTCTTPNTCGGGGTAGECGCTALTTCPAADNCGTIPNECGSTVSCGPACTSPDTCGGGGTANVCGCTPLTTCPAADNCGTIPNGCGGTVACGAACASPDTCGGGGTANVCGCTPLTTCPAADNCGTIPNGCGGTVSCGAACTAPQTCAGGGTANVCGCTPLTKCPAADNCGTISDTCGGTVSCGTCTAPQTCSGSGTANVCGCTPLTACPAADTCGTISDTCGGTVTCGTCGASQTCANNQCVAGTSDDSGAPPPNTDDSGAGAPDSSPGAGDDASTIGDDSGVGAGGSDDGGGSDGSANGAAVGSPSGCSCRTAGATDSRSPALAGVGALMLLGAVRRRRRRSAA